MNEKLDLRQRNKATRKVLWITFFLNLLVAMAKSLIGLISGSVSMIADGVHSLFDSFGNVVGLAAVSFAGKPADRTHPYGHGKFETYGSLIIGILLLFAAFGVGSTAVSKLVSQNYSAQISYLSFIIMVLTLAVNVFVAVYERRSGHKYNSELLIADASHTLSDALVSIGVIFGLILVAVGFPMADPIAALIVTVVILLTAFDVFKSAFATFTDKARLPDDIVEKIALSFPSAILVHKIRSRGREGEIYADLHIVVDPNLPVEKAHNLAHDVERAIEQEFDNVVEVLVHIEPGENLANK